MKYRRLRVAGGTYFFTVVAAGRAPILHDAQAVQTLQGAIAGVRARYPFEIEAFVILPGHLHVIWSMPENDSDFSKRWMLIKSRHRRLCAGPAGAPLWQNRFWEHLIHDDGDYANHIEYIHYNPVKHGLVAAPRDWPHSSFHDFVARGDYDSDWGSGDMPKWPASLDKRSE